MDVLHAILFLIARALALIDYFLLLLPTESPWTFLNSQNNNDVLKNSSLF